jgi:phosphonate transport system ATP-binding protein
MTDPRQAARLISFDGVTKRFADGTMALRRVRCDVGRGQFCVVLGSSGAGKSTLLRSVNGLVEPTEGRVQVGGETVEKKSLRRIRPRIGMIHQQFNLAPRLSVAKNVLTGALPEMTTASALLHLFSSIHKRRACEWVARVGLGEEHLTRRAQDLSGGQQQRVGIARAFMLDPWVVLADEPVASLDPKTSRDILTLLKQASKERLTTVLCSLHQVELGREFADRIIGMRAGQIVFDGLPDALSEAVLQQIYGSDRLSDFREIEDGMSPAPAGFLWQARA